MEVEVKLVEKIVEIERIKIEKEVVENKKHEELFTTQKDRVEKATLEKKEMEEEKRAVRREKERIKKEKAKSKEEHVHTEQAYGSRARIPVINVVPLIMVIPIESPMQGVVIFPRL